MLGNGWRCLDLVRGRVPSDVEFHEAGQPILCCSTSMRGKDVFYRLFLSVKLQCQMSDLILMSRRRHHRSLSCRCRGLFPDGTIVSRAARAGHIRASGLLADRRKNHPAASREVSNVADDAGLKVLDVSYIYRSFDDDAFLARVGGEEWAQYVVDGTVELAFGLLPEAAPPVEITVNFQSADVGEKEKMKEGILPISVNSRASDGLRKRFKGASQGSLGEMNMLDLNLCILRSGGLADVLNYCTGKLKGDEGIVDLNLSALMEDRLLEPKTPGSYNLALSSVCRGLERLTVSILRARSFGRIAWTRVEEGSWEERET